MNHDSGFEKFLTTLCCVVLALVLAALLMVSHIQQRKTTRELEAKATQAMMQDGNNTYETTVVSGSSSADSSASSATSNGTDASSASSTSASTSAASSVSSDSAADTKNAKTAYTAISIRGDSYMEDDADRANGYPAKLQALLQAAGSGMTVEDDTWDMAGTLSQMSLAGIDQQTVQNYISKHTQNGLTDSYDTIVRADLSQYLKDRDDQSYLPVLTMGYHGGWGNDLDELVEQEKAVLATYENGDKDYLVLGSYPSGWTDHTAYDTAMTQAFGNHYISLNSTVTASMMSEDGRQQIAQTIFNKLKEFNYIS